MHDAKRRRLKAILFVLILLVHALTFWFLFYKPFPDAALFDPSLMPTRPDTPNTPPMASNNWAAMRAGGAPVVLHQPAQQESQETPSEEQDTANQEQAESPQEIEEPKAEPEQAKNKVEPRALDESIKSAMTSLITSTEIEKPREEKPAQETAKSEKKEAKKAAPKAAPTPPTPTAQKTIPFTQLVDGFSRQLSDGGTDPYSMKGSAVGKATAEQLKHGNYRNKIAECIQKSILANRTKAVIRNDGHYALTIDLSIARSGALQHLSIKESCGVATLDLFILKAVQDAASSFPPVPASLGNDSYPMPIFFENIIAIIQHPELLRWTL